MVHPFSAEQTALIVAWEALVGLLHSDKVAWVSLVANLRHRDNLPSCT